MLSKIIMPPGGQTTNESMITKWHKKVGDKVKRGDILFEIETDKATLQIESYAAGILLASYFEEGDKVNTGTIVAYVGTAGEKIPEEVSLAVDAENNVKKENIGDSSNLCSEKTSKTGNGQLNTAEFTCADDDAEDHEEDEYTPIVKGQNFAGETAKVYKSVAAKINKHESNITESNIAESNIAEFNTKAPYELVSLLIQATPKARMAAKESGKDLKQIYSHLKRLIKYEDVLNFSIMDKTTINKEMTTGQTSLNPTIGNPTICNPTICNPTSANQNPSNEDQKEKEFYFVKTSGMRKTIANKMCKSVSTSPQYKVSMDMNMTKAISFRSVINEFASKDGVKISFNDIIMKSVAKAIKKYPLINSVYGDDEIKIYNTVNIGLAVGIEGGLVVPVIKDVFAKSISTISIESSTAVKSVKSLSYDRRILSGGTITLSNLGMYGVSQFTAILNEPESCILAIGGIEDKAVFQNGTAVAIPTMNITGTFDHRVIDGSSGAQFLKELKTIIENPELLAY